MHIFSRLLYLIFFLGFFLSLNGQTSTPASLEWGNQYSEPNNTTATKIIGLRPDGFYMLRQKVLNNPESRPRAWVEFYDRDMNLKKAVEQDLKYKGKQRDFEDVVFIGGQLYLLTSFNNSGQKKNYLFKQRISMKSLITAKKLEMICETDARNKEAEGSFGSHISKDSTKLLIYNDLPYKKNEQEQFGFRVFNQQFELIWEKDVVLPYTDNRFTVEEYQVDELGNVHLMGVLYEDNAKRRRRGSPTYQYIIISYLDNGERVEEFRVGLDNKFITDLTFRPTKSGKLICAGFYSERGTYSVKGAYYFKVDPTTRAVSHKNYQPFEFEFLTEFMSDRSKEKAKDAEKRRDVRKTAELYNFSLDELILRSDGGAVLVAEQFYIEEQYNRNDRYGIGYYPYSYGSLYNNRYGNNNQADYYYNYNDIIVVNIRPTGEVEWASRISKKQETRNDGGYYSSYAMSIVRDKIYFLYNENSRNFAGGGKNNRIYNFNGSNSVIAVAQVNKNGEVKTYPLASNKDAGVITRPKICKQIGKKKMAVFGEKGKGYKFANLIFD